jgi:hypothetical protein
MEDRAAFGVEAAKKLTFTSAIEDLARRIEYEWADVQYDDGRFPEIAERVLMEEQLHERYNAHDVIREGILGRLTVPQIDPEAKFGQPPITFFRNSRFYVAAQFWADATTAIHEHGFSGAFSVLGGASLHVRYRFTPRIRVNSRLSVGGIEQESANILERGTVKGIVAGPEGAHALFHLERPSTTLIIRTHRDSRAQPQLTYLWPCYAIDPFFEDHAIDRKCQLLRLVHETDNDSFQRIGSDLLATLDFESTVRVLLYLRQLNLGVHMALELAAVAAHQHRELGEGLVQLVEAGHREDRLISLRRRVFDPERRLLLGFLLNRLSAVDVKALVARKYPDSDAADLVTAWTASLLEAEGGMERSPLVRRAIQLLLTSKSLAVVNHRLFAEFDIMADDDRDAAAALVRTLSDSPLLSSLLGAPTSINSSEDECASANSVGRVSALTAMDGADAGINACDVAAYQKTSHSPIFSMEHYLSPAACLALREEYNDGLRRGCFAPRGMACTDIALSRVTSNDALARLHLDVGERIRSHFKLPELRLDYCAYTRIRPGGSHVLHADGVTLEGGPNHTPDRVATAMLFLSDGEVDFEGGTLRFPIVGMEITPRIGLLVGFLSSLEYQHEVPSVTAGARDALAMWFQRL